ncbi:threonine aldolase [Desulfonema ishimotonii]|uniref:Threonine aldolase n=1 Tax=Desulfonema ishimotonii TaxID=45657 RepID=A0A401FTG0_9BACT|nr:low specificity L-threonine aldolase [Desulfonema ishimotonii]GBC60251.1 threonine aldolase [Desulfonema ishimotonii]
MMTQKNKRGFASDNNAGVHPEILKAMAAANAGHTVAYGDDDDTRKAVENFKAHLGDDIGVFFVFLGTGANVLALQAAAQPYHSVICAETAHIHVDECAAPERFTGCKLLTVPTADGKLTVEGIRTHMHGIGFEHHAQPRVISVTQATELGTVYTPEEIRAITDFAHENNMVVHMDGARLANAAVHLNAELRELTTDVGIDILSFGGTKNGMMYGEAIVFSNTELARNFKYIRKQGMQLASKMRFISAQFNALLGGNLWRKNAAHANAMAKLLAREVEKIPQISITQKVEANGVFAIVPPEYVPELQKEFFFYVWDEATSEVRWMTSFDTTTEDVLNFSALLGKIVG